MNKFGILQQNVLLCGYNQGTMVELKAAFKMQAKYSIASIICISGLLPIGPIIIPAKIMIRIIIRLILTKVFYQMYRDHKKVL